MRAISLALIGALALAACRKEPPAPEPGGELRAQPATAVNPVKSPPPKPEPPPATAPLKTPWGEDVPSTHRHPADAWISVFDLGGIFDLATRGLPAINAAGEIALATSITAGDEDASTLALEIGKLDDGDRRKVVVIYSPRDDGDRFTLDAARERVAIAHAMLAGARWTPMLGLESVGNLRAGVEQKLASADGAATASFVEPRLTLSVGGRTLAVDGSRWSCARGAGLVLLSGVWIDLSTGSVVARVGYEGTDCDPIFALARAR